MCKVKANNGLDGVLTLMASPGLFYNECEISFKVTIVPLCEDLSTCSYHWKCNLPITRSFSRLVDQSVGLLVCLS